MPYLYQSLSRTIIDGCSKPHCAQTMPVLRERSWSESSPLRGHSRSIIQPRTYSALVFDECLLLRASGRALFARPNRPRLCSGWRFERTAFAHWLAVTDRLRPIHARPHAFAIPAFAQNRLTPTSDATLPNRAYMLLVARHRRLSLRQLFPRTEIVITRGVTSPPLRHAQMSRRHAR